MSVRPFDFSDPPEDRSEPIFTRCNVCGRELVRNDEFAIGMCAVCANEETPACPTCKGSGHVNPLTAPKGFLCIGTTECPDCDGSGDMP